MIKTKVTIYSVCLVDGAWIAFYERSRHFLWFSLPLHIGTAFAFTKTGIYQKSSDMTVVEADVQRAIMEYHANQSN